MLVPELCYITGMSDAMKNDFRVMKDIAEHTRLVPKLRVEVRKILLFTAVVFFFAIFIVSSHEELNCESQT
jgi:hypothetical protein